MQSNFPKIPFFISIAFFILTCLAFLFFFRAINANDREAQMREGEWQTEANRRDEIRSLDASVILVQAERAELETHFAKSSDIVPFLDTIEGLAIKVNTKAEVTSVDILDDHTGLNVGMKASGTFAGLYRFITLLENSPYELEFVSMDLQKGAEIVGTNDIKTTSWDMIFKIKLLSFIE